MSVKIRLVKSLQSPEQVNQVILFVSATIQLTIKELFSAMVCDDFACVTLFNQINEDNRRLILNQERSLFFYSAGESGLQNSANLHSASQFARVANWHVLNVVKNGGTAKVDVNCNVAIRMIFWGTGERTISCFKIWSISAYAIVNSFHRK